MFKIGIFLNIHIVTLYIPSPISIIIIMLNIHFKYSKSNTKFSKPNALSNNRFSSGSIFSIIFNNSSAPIASKIPPIPVAIGAINIIKISNKSPVKILFPPFFIQKSCHISFLNIL